VRFSVLPFTRRIRQTSVDLRGGKLYDSTWGVRQRGEGVFAQQIRTLFDIACRKYGMNEKHYNLSTASFRRPTDQGSLF